MWPSDISFFVLDEWWHLDALDSIYFCIKLPNMYVGLNANSMQVVVGLWIGLLADCC